MDPKLIDDLTKRLYKTLPDNLKDLQDDLKQNFRGILQNSLNKMDLVSREEFEIQKMILAKCRKQINELKAKLTRQSEDE